MRTRGWRRIGTVDRPVARPDARGVVRDGADRSAGAARATRPATTPARTCLHDAPAVVGYAAAERHFSQARLNPELLMIETDHDMRNPADMLVLEPSPRRFCTPPVSPWCSRSPGPSGTPIEHSSIPFRSACRVPASIMNLSYQQDRMPDMLKQANEISNTIDILKQQLALQQQSAAATARADPGDSTTAVTIERLARQDGQFRRLLPAAAQLLLLGTALFRHPDVLRRCGSVFDSLDGISTTQRPIRQASPQVWTSSTRCSRSCWRCAAADRHPGSTIAT